MFQFSQDKPIYLQIYDDLVMKIVSGHYKPGDKLESVRELALYYTVNPNTIQRVITELVNQDMVIIERGRGSFVTTQNQVITKFKINLVKDELKTTVEKLIQMGLSKSEMIHQVETIITEVMAHDDVM